MPLISRFTNVILFMVLVGTALFAYQRGKSDARLDCANEKTQQARQELTNTIKTIKSLTVDAMRASQTLSEQIAARSVADAKTTQEIRHALNANPARKPCLFDANIMQQLDAARDNANRATTGGINHTLPVAGGAGKQ